MSGAFIEGNCSDSVWNAVNGRKKNRSTIHDVIPAKAGIHLDLAPAFAFESKAKAFRATRESLFFERQRKVTKRKPPYVAPGGEAAGFASGEGFFGSSILLLQKRRTSMCAAPAGFYLPRLPRLTGLNKKAKAQSQNFHGNSGSPNARKSPLSKVGRWL
ncbi:MAG TPA: hypothetical protein VF471_09080 [Pseudoxanthomonas sp.]